MDTELIEKIAEKVGGRTSFLLGAGASAAVGLPTMVSFLDKSYGEGFVKEIINGKQYVINASTIDQVSSNEVAMAMRLFQTAGLNAQKPPVDLEELFQFIHKSKVLKTDTDTIKALLWMFRTCSEGQGWNYNQYKEQYRNYSSSLDRWMSDFQKTITNLRERMYQSFLIDQSASEILKKAKANQNLLRRIDNSKTTIFTTNFDTIYEALAVDEGIFLNDGFGKERNPLFKLTNFLRDDSGSDAINYFKIHGSVTWHRNGNGQVRDCFPMIPKNVALLEPVLSKTPNELPFTDIYKIFEKVLSKNEVCVSIGFSFRDDMVRNIIEKQLNSSTTFRLIIVAPEEKEHPQLNEHLQRLSSQRGVFWIKKFWGSDEVVDEILNTMNIRLPIGKLSLNDGQS